MIRTCGYDHGTCGSKGGSAQLVEISSRLFGGAGAGGEPSVVGKMVLDAIKATKVEGLARRPGESWVELLRFARARRARPRAPRRRRRRGAS